MHGTDGLEWGVGGLFLLLLVAIVVKPAVALVVAGVLAVIGGVFALALGGLFGPALAINGIVGGIVLVGLGRLIAFVEALLMEARAVNGSLGRQATLLQKLAIPPRDPKQP